MSKFNISATETDDIYYMMFFSKNSQNMRSITLDLAVYFQLYPAGIYLDNTKLTSWCIRLKYSWTQIVSEMHQQLPTKSAFQKFQIGRDTVNKHLVFAKTEESSESSTKI